jgi:SNF2 family DNA or RNA helicase
VLVVQPQSAAHGVTLTAANTICWYGPTFSVETWLQANARIDRKGQENKMTVVRLVGSPVEERAYKALDVKEAAQFDLMGLYKSVLQD